MHLSAQPGIVLNGIRQKCLEVHGHGDAYSISKVVEEN